MYMYYFAVHLKLIPHCKSTHTSIKNKNEKKKKQFISYQQAHRVGIWQNDTFTGNSA